MASTSFERFEELLADQEASVRQAFLEFIELVQSEPIMASIIERLEMRDTEGAMRIVDSYIARLADVFPAIQATVGAATAAEIAEIIPDIALAVSFDPSHPRAAEIARSHRGRFIREFSQGQRQAAAQAIERAFRTGAGTHEAARSLRASMGLTAYQEQIIENYRANLVNLDRDALDRVLRDRRFDPTVSRAIETGRPLTQAQIDRMVERYRARWIDMRATTIATTEAGRATSEAREESLEQMAEQTGIDRRRIERVWNATRDNRVRDFHASMQGQKRGMTEDFIDGLGNRLRYPHDPRAPAETTINCRCGLTFNIKPPGAIL